MIVVFRVQRTSVFTPHQSEIAEAEPEAPPLPMYGLCVGESKVATS